MLRAATTDARGGTPAILSPAFIAEGCFVHVSGQGPLVGGTYKPDSIDVEIRQAFQNLGVVLETAGSSLDRVVRCSVFLADIQDLESLNEIWEEVFAVPRPARTTIQAAALPGGIKVEVDCVALLASDRRDQLRRAADELGDKTVDVSLVPDWTAA